MRLAAAALVLLASITCAVAQTPFDMSPERPAEMPPAEAAPPAAPGAAPPATPAPAAPATFRRYLLPSDPMVLEGEIASRSWAIYLTDAEAASPIRLQLAYQNAIVIAPEASRLSVAINGAAVIDESISSPQGMRVLTADIPAGAMKPGRNEIVISAQHRHRTDCTIESTYELWTELDAPQTFLEFGSVDAAQLGGFQDLRAIGGDPSGRTHVSIVAPSLGRADIRADLMMLAQIVGLYVNHPDVDYSISDSVDTERPATIRVLLGTAEELSGLGIALPPGAALGPTAAFVAPQPGQPATLAVTGRNEGEWRSAIAQMRGPVDRPALSQRQSINTQTWRLPDAPMIYAATRIPFSQLGIRSEQFSGRRYHTSFQFAIPADFYAGSYGIARILLDAAYSSAVRPGSLINIYVNGNIAATLPITNQNGAILDKLPVKVTMRHFRPGLNEIAIDVELLTEQDAACLPGATTNADPRFAIFGTSEFAMPDFARISQRPNLSALAGTGWPYGRTEGPVALVSERSDMESLTAAAEFLSRMALGAGRPIAVTFSTTADGARSANAIFLGPIGAIVPSVLGQVGIDATGGRSAWTRIPESGAAPQPDGISIDAWRDQVGDGWLRDRLGAFERWMSETFSITVDMLRFAPVRRSDFVPGQDVSLVVAQGPSPGGDGLWTVVTAPDAQVLRRATGQLTTPRNWSRIDGAITTLGGDGLTVETVPVSTLSFVQSQPASFTNYRLIAANFLSSNILSYSLFLVLACLLLGVTTSGLLSRLGRRR